MRIQNFLKETPLAQENNKRQKAVIIRDENAIKISPKIPSKILHKKWKTTATITKKYAKNLKNVFIKKNQKISYAL